MLFQSLGEDTAEVAPDIHHLQLEDGDQLLLCTDGLTALVDDRAIESLLNLELSAKLACRVLVDTALKNGGLDNITAVVARYSIPDRSETNDSDSRSRHQRIAEKVNNPTPH
jgi:protein phosphatase